MPRRPSRYGYRNRPAKPGHQISCGTADQYCIRREQPSRSHQRFRHASCAPRRPPCCPDRKTIGNNTYDRHDPDTFHWQGRRNDNVKSNNPSARRAVTDRPDVSRRVVAIGVGIWLIVVSRSSKQATDDPSRCQPRSQSTSSTAIATPADRRCIRDTCGHCRDGSGEQRGRRTVPPANTTTAIAPAAIRHVKQCISLLHWIEDTHIATRAN